MLPVCFIRYIRLGEAMCQYIIVYHIYNSCRLKEIVPEEVKDGAEDEPRPSRLAQYLSLFTNRGKGPPSPTGTENGNAGAAQQQPATEVEDEFEEEKGCHLVKAKTILQCNEANTNPHWANRPEKERVCDNPTAYFEENPELRSNVNTGECPVCQAVIAALRKSSNPIIIVSISILLDSASAKVC
jgi:hypothetical protein